MQIAGTLENDKFLSCNVEVKRGKKQTDIFSVLKFADPIHLLPEFHAVEH